jgi:hypothetical protein
MILFEYLSKLFRAFGSGFKCPLPLLLAAVASNLFSRCNNKVWAHILCKLVVLAHVHLSVKVKHKMFLIIEPTCPLFVS